ncbi:MAG: hypothetical protein JW969_01035 [Spirochaetales bacterium]|nr:hypothetical protein [Spirochaetales bacterium]
MVKKNSVIILLVSVLLLILAGCQGNNRVSIYYTASLYGNLDGCTCKSRPRAGLVKRARYLKDNMDKGNILLVDGGDVLLDTPDEDLSIQILEAYKDLGYAAIGVGINELANGIDFLLKLREAFPYISNNITVTIGEPEPFTREPLLVKSGECNIGIFSLFDPGLLTDPRVAALKKIKITPLEQSARDCLSNLKERKADLTVLLFFGLHEDLVDLLDKVKGIDLVVLAFEQSLIESERIGDTVIYSPGEEGNRLGMVDVTLNNGAPNEYANSFVLFSYFNDPDDPVVRTRIKKYEMQMRERLINKQMETLEKGEPQ